MFQKEDQSVWIWQSDRSNKISVQPVSGLKDITEIFYDYGEIFATDSAGQLFIPSKSNGSQDLTSFLPLSGIDQVAHVGRYIYGNNGYHYLFLKKDGMVWIDDSSLHSFAPVKNAEDIIQLESNSLLKQDGTVWMLPKSFDKGEKYNSLQATQIKKLSGIKKIKNDDRYKNAFIAIDSKSRLWFWGATITGYSDGTTFHENLEPILLTGISHIKDAYFVERSLVVLTENNEVYETSIQTDKMQSNASFRLLAKDVTEIKTGLRHIIMQKTDGSLWGWGVNKNAELGYGDYEFQHDSPVAVQRPISVSTNGTDAPLTNGVITRNSQNFVPLRSVFEQFGAEIIFDGTTKLATVSSSDGSTVIQVNAVTGQITLNNEPIVQENKPFNVNGSLYLPIRFISEKLGAKVDWLPAEERIAITMPNN